jgi:23S rRNA pseudouridine2604 synthase
MTYSNSHSKSNGSNSSGGNANEPVRISKRMSELGMASRREADYWLEQGWVLVDGVPAILGQKVVPSQKITLQRAAHTQQATQVTFLLHKPIGYVSGQAEDGYQNAAALITAGNRWAGCTAPQKFNFSQLKGLAPAGRLDIDSTGLLALTQDGRIAKLLIGEDSDIEKEYLVRVQYMRGREGERLPESALGKLRHGLELDGKYLKPAVVEWQNEDQLRFVLIEGKKRQIRRMCELVGLKVLGLKRVGIGSVLLRDLPMGQWRYLQAGERFDNELKRKPVAQAQFAGDVRFANPDDDADYEAVYGDVRAAKVAEHRASAPKAIKRAPSFAPAPQGRPRERARFDPTPEPQERQRPGRPSTRTGDRKPAKSGFRSR